MLAAFAGCGGSEMDSRWRSNEITIDGNTAEWQDAMVRVDDAHGMIGIVNDSSYLYLTLLSDDPALERQVMFRGLTVWFDPKGGKEKKFGIRYPAGMRPAGYARRTDESDQEERPEGLYGGRADFDSTEAELLGPGEGEHRMVTTVQLRRIAVKARFTGGVMAYELRIPLSPSADAPQAPAFIAGTTIGIGLETGSGPGMERGGEPPRDEAPRGGGYGGGGYGGRGGRHGGGGGSSSRPQEHKPLEVWLTSKLAAAKSPTPP